MQPLRIALLICGLSTPNAFAQTQTVPIDGTVTVPVYDDTELRSRLSDLEQRVRTLEEGSVDPDPDPLPNLKQQLTQDDFVLLGGCLLEYSDFARGSLFVERVVEGHADVWFNAHAQRQDVHCSRINLQQLIDRGPSVAAMTSFKIPLQKQLFGLWSHAVHCGYYSSRAVTRPNPGGPLLWTSYSSYATGEDTWRGPYMQWINADNTKGPPVSTSGTLDKRAVYGGGFCDIPQWFADAHLGGANFGIGWGGYHSGQGSTAGPSLYAVQRPSDNQASLSGGVSLLHYGPFNMTTPKEQREYRPPDYSGDHWGPQPDGDIGYFADSINAGPCWVDTPKASSLLYISVQGVGEMDYACQCEGLSNVRVPRLYSYRPDDLARVAAGEMKAYEPRGYSGEWYGPFSPKLPQDHKHWPIGMAWDGEYLYVLYNQVGPAYGYEHALCIYELKAEE